MHEGERSTFEPVTDETNFKNEWQGQLRTAPLHLPSVRDFIRQDEVRGWRNNVLPSKLGITWLDHADRLRLIDIDGNEHTVMNRFDVPQVSSTALHRQVALTSFGPSSKDVRLNDL